MAQSLRSTPSVRRYGSFPTTADVGLWARGSDPASLFQALGIGLFALMTDVRKVRPRMSRSVTASGTDTKALVVDFLSRLIVLEETEGFLARTVDVEVEGDAPTHLKATVRGEPFDPSRHRRKKEVKAITLHRLAIDLKRGTAQVIVDI